MKKDLKRFSIKEKRWYVAAQDRENWRGSVELDCRMPQRKE